jgi:hypothetical protein
VSARPAAPCVVHLSPVPVQKGLVWTFCAGVHMVAWIALLSLDCTAAVCIVTAVQVSTGCCEACHAGLLFDGGILQMCACMV